jgi:AcrR family transcriptional regulator
MPITENQLRILKENNEESHREARLCIKNALVELLKKKRYSDISMTDIIKKSGVSRAGVYKNYKGKTEIMLDIYAEFLDDIIAALSRSIYENVEIIFTIAQKNKAALKALIDAGLEHHLLDMMNECYEDVADPYYMSMWMGMIYNSLIKWAKSGMDEPLDMTIERIRSVTKLVAESINKATVTYFKPADQRDVSSGKNRRT